MNSRVLFLLIGLGLGAVVGYLIRPRRPRSTSGLCTFRFRAIMPLGRKMKGR